ncbi:unnamed protein product [Blepharisma stoltei]|uniref:Uncharacterized protein n=1 Tax=Blepharisma stoltei TaxID=1481888 RepID=A0AAU9JJH9_9CILI|nr:unnamed protein product [Blepharisma stoltei]
MEDRQTKIDYISQVIASIDCPPIGNLENLSQENQEQTIKCLLEIISRFQREQYARQETTNKLFDTQNELKEASREIDRLTDTKYDLENEISRLQNSLTTNNLKFKQERDKLTQEREDLRKENAKLNSRDVQFQHEIKKQEAAYARLQDQLRKAISDREPVKNSIEVVQNIHTNGINLESAKGDREFLYFIQRGYERSMDQAGKLVEVLISNLNDCFKEMSKVIEFKTKERVNWKPIGIEEDAKEIENTAKERINLMKQATEDMEQLKDDDDFPSYTVPQLKQLLSIYKETIEQHQKLLTQMQEN